MIKSWFHKNFIDNNTKHWYWRIIEKSFYRYCWALKLIFHLRNKEVVNNISIVVVGRNDNYGGDFSQRLKISLDWNLMNLPNSELVYVEWNQIPDRPSDTEWISKRYPNSKCFIVPNEIHKLFCENDKIMMMEYFAKNVGLREASNEWIAIINADVLLAENCFKNLKKLNKDYVYGTNYINIDMNSVKIKNGKLEKTVINTFSTNFKLMSVVGNFILTHKKNWFKMGGYDENLRNVRAGVDNNGLFQLLYLGVKTMVIGDHYHLDHSESLINGSNETHGYNEIIKNNSNIPYNNAITWGLRDFTKEKISENIYKFKK
jgi:hypothetical protein